MPRIRSPSSTPGLSMDEEAEREIREAMEDMDNDEFDELAGDTDLPDMQEVSQAGQNLSLPSDLCRELAAARRKCDLLKLHPYQRTAVEDFIKSTSMARQVSLFTQLFALGNSVASLKTEAPPFVSSPQLLDNIKSISIAVLLSCNLSAYKQNSVPLGHVMTVLTARGYLPENISNDSYARKVIKADIQVELTQTRAKIKKAIRDSIKANPCESSSIFDLATAIISNSKSSISVPLCARIALLRKIFIEESNVSFWDKVDARLTIIRHTAAGDARKITRAFESFLEKDRNTYGDDTTYTLEGANDVFQDSIDQLITEPSE